jgi:hypothetical protein
MAQPPQTEAADGGANVAQLCAAQKLLYADAIAPAHPQNAAKALTMENLKPLQLGGRDGPGLCSIQQEVTGSFVKSFRRPDSAAGHAMRHGWYL